MAANKGKQEEAAKKLLAGYAKQKEALKAAVVAEEDARQKLAAK